MKKAMILTTLLTALTMTVSLIGCGSTAETSVSSQAESIESEAAASASSEAESAEAEAAGDADPADRTEPASDSTEASAAAQASSARDADLSMIDMDAWQYESGKDVYWQVGISYCADPADESYETLGIFIPGAYLNGTKNADGTYSCTINEEASAGGYTAATAPILFPVNTPGYKAQDAPDSFVKGCTTYTGEGFIYVSAGCRGKDTGLPSGVADLKAAIRYIRYNEELLPGDTERIVVYGHSGGGAQCAILGSSGDSALYDPYLKALGAADTSDAVAAVMSWCPITSFDSADLGYEWNMGTTRDDLSGEMQTYSDALAAAYADYVNAMGFTDENGELLTLTASDEGIYQAGSYYDYVKNIIEESLEHYLTDTEFPVSGKSGSYDSAEDYLASLCKDEEWISYDAETGDVTIADIASFAEHCKEATKPIAAFDKLDEGGHVLFNTGDGEETHFDTVLYEIIAGSSYEEEFAEDLAKTDSLGSSMAYRLHMYSPLYYLVQANEGYGTSNPAEFWRIRSGITQTDTALTTEINLALALNAFGADVDFETVWAQGHTQAERTGDSTDNFIEWIHSLWADS